jgi:hypothetical protein
MTITAKCKKPDHARRENAIWDSAASKVTEKLETVLGIARKECKKIGGKTNVAYNAVNRHANSWRRDKVAYIFWESPWAMCARSPILSFTEVNRSVNALKA